MSDLILPAGRPPQSGEAGTFVMTAEYPFLEPSVLDASATVPGQGKAPTFPEASLCPAVASDAPPSLAKTILGVPYDKESLLAGAPPALAALLAEAQRYWIHVTLEYLEHIPMAAPSLDTEWWDYVPACCKPFWADYSHETRLALFCLAFWAWETA